MGFLDYLDKKQNLRENVKIKKSHNTIKEIKDTNEYIITDLGETITFTENIMFKRYCVWDNSTMIDSCNDLDALIEKYGDIEVIGRNKKSTENNFKIQEKKIRRKKVDNIEELEENETGFGLDRASLILEGLLEDSEISITNTENSVPNSIQKHSEDFTRPLDVSNHASLLL
ncbi:MAG: hypothetical protein WC260_01795 [Candidatus Pacearchaeota archaeon]